MTQITAHLRQVRYLLTEPPLEKKTRTITLTAALLINNHKNSENVAVNKVAASLGIYCRCCAIFGTTPATTSVGVVPARSCRAELSAALVEQVS